MAAGVPLAAVSPAWTLAVWAVVVGAAVLDGRRTAAAEVDRPLPSSVPLGGEFDVRLRVRTSPDRLVRVTDDTDPAVGRRAPRGAVVDAAGPAGAWARTDGDGLAVVGYLAEARERGNRSFGTVHVWVRSPWGLAERWTRAELDQTVRVLPGIEKVVGRSVAILRRSDHLGIRSLRRLGEGTEFESLREYTPGDDPRSIDWKASARHGSFVIRRYQVERSQNLVLAVDCGRLMREEVEGRERLDFALAACMMLAERARVFGDRVGLIAFDRTPRIVVPASRVRIGALADTLAGLESSTSEPNYPLAFAELRRSFRKRALVVLFSDVVDGEASSPLIRGMLGIRRQHLPLMVALRNPVVDQAATHGGGGDDSLRVRAAAVDLLEARSRALERMGRSGVQIVDALPGPGVEAVLKRGGNEVGERVCDAQMRRLRLDPHPICPQWNYTLRPRPIHARVTA